NAAVELVVFSWYILAKLLLSEKHLLNFFNTCILVLNPAQAYLGENTTLKILIENEPSNIITWNFKGGNQILNVALLRPEGVKVNERYKGRASIDSANGHLTLTSAQLNDSGNYTVLVLGENTTEIGIVKLHVVGEKFIYCF
uniref:Immunoglobulin domain-containing protein n=1 Tax=Xiphophorus couchianus TaxID=32473 RepID=A0A3B5KT85_9TELE